MSQFIISGFATPFTVDQIDKGRGKLAYIREDIPSKLLKTPGVYDHAECLAIEINLKTIWLLMYSYNLLKLNIVYHLNSLEKILDHNLLQYNRSFQIGDLMRNMRNIFVKFIIEEMFLKNQLALKTPVNLLVLICS